MKLRRLVRPVLLAALAGAIVCSHFIAKFFNPLRWNRSLGEKVVALRGKK